MSHRLDLQYGIRPHFKYVTTTQNPANLITIGLTLKKFMSSLEFLYHGPSLLHDRIHHWLTQNLHCLGRQSCQIAQSSAGTGKECHFIILLGQFSTFTHLLKITFLVFKFISRLRRQEGNCDRKAALYLMKTATKGICKGDSFWTPLGGHWEDMILRTSFHWGGKTTYYQTYCNGWLF